MADVDTALQAAADGFDAVRSVSADDRAAFLDRIAEEILALGDALIERAGEESGLPAARLTGERGRTVGQIRAFADVVREGSWVDACIDHAIPDREPLPKPDVRRMLIPLGPVAVFGASNFPLAFSVAGGDAASALASGCPIVVKAHPAHPGTSELVAAAIDKAAKATNMPAAIFSMLHGRSHSVGLGLVEHDATSAVGFTGSLGGGRALFDAAARRMNPIPVYAEMGSTNPVFMLPGALAERGEQLAAGMQQSVTLGVGQFCTNPGLVVCEKGAARDKFVDALQSAIEASAPATMLHGGIRDSYEAGIKRLSSTAGVSVLAASSQSCDATKTEAGAALFGTDAAAFLADQTLAEEVFGPSTVLVNCGSREELERIASSLDGHLTATVHGTPQDLKDYASLVSILEKKVGRLIFNGFPTGVEVCPSMHHGGPYPATTDGRTTSVGTAAITRFARPLCYQGWPNESLPEELRDDNPRGIWRLVDGERTRATS